MILETCKDCLAYQMGRVLTYPNTPDEANTWRQCLNGSTVNGKSMMVVMHCNKYIKEHEPKQEVDNG